MTQETFWDRIQGRISRAYEWLTRMFLSCDGNRCSGFVPALFVENDKGLFPLSILGSERGKEKIYVYYCPWCGRRMAQKGKSR